MDKVLVVGLLIVASVVTATILFGVFRTSIEQSGRSSTAIQERASEQAETGLAIVEVIPGNDGTRVDLWVKNVGSVEIQPIRNLDLFMTDIDGSYGGYLEYSDSGPVAGEDTWSLVSQVDPQWDPGETIHIQVSLLQNPISTGEYTFSLNAPRNVGTSLLFRADPKVPPVLIPPAVPPPAPPLPP